MISGIPISGAPIAGSGGATIAHSILTKAGAWRGSDAILPWFTIRPVDGMGAPLVRQMAAEFIPDPSSYAGGPKPAQVVTFGTTARIASDIKSRPEQDSQTIIVGDPKGEIAGWFANDRQRNALGYEVSIDYRLGSDRRNGIQPAPNWHGLIKSWSGLPNKRFQFQGWGLIPSLQTATFSLPRIGDYFTTAPTANLDRLGPRRYGRLSDERAGGGAGVVSWRAPASIASFNADLTFPTDGLVVLFNSGDAPGQVLINGVTVAEATVTQGFSIGVPYAAGQTVRLNTSSGSGLLAWFFGLDGETWGTPVTLTLDADFTEAAHGMVLLYNPGSQGGIYSLAGVDYAEVVSSFTFPTSGTGASANAPYLGGQTGHVRTAGGTGLAATFYPFVGGSTWSAPVALPIDASDFTETADGLVQLYDAGNETGTYTMTGTSFAQANEVYHMAVGAPYQHGQTARITPWGGSDLRAWFFALNGSSPVSGTSPKGVVPGIDVGGPWVDLTGDPWDRAYVFAAHAVKGNFTLYTRDSSGVVTPLASLDDTQISAPGRTGFTARWGATPYRVINDWNWTLVYVKGALAASLAAGTVTLWGNFDGVETKGDGTGTRLDSPVDFLAHILDNDALPRALNLPVYAGGNWAPTIPVYGDGRAARNAIAFAKVKGSLAFYLDAEGVGDAGYFSITSSVAYADLIAGLCVDCEADQWPDENGAFSLDFKSPDPTAGAVDVSLGESEIEAGSVSWQDQTTTDYCYNRITYSYAPIETADGSASTPTTAVEENDAAIANMRGLVIDASETLNLLTRRDNVSAQFIALRNLARAAPAPRDVTLTTGLFALSLMDLGDVIEVNHPDLPQQPMTLQVRGMQTDWDRMAVTLSLRGLATLIVPTTLTVPDVLMEYSASDQNVPVSALVTALFGPTADGGTVSFQVKNGSTPIGSPATGSLVLGTADATYTVPGGTGA